MKISMSTACALAILALSVSVSHTAAVTHDHATVSLRSLLAEANNKLVANMESLSMLEIFTSGKYSYGTGSGGIRGNPDSLLMCAGNPVATFRRLLKEDGKCRAVQDNTYAIEVDCAPGAICNICLNIAAKDKGTTIAQSCQQCGSIKPVSQGGDGGGGGAGTGGGATGGNGGSGGAGGIAGQCMVVGHRSRMGHRY